MKNNEIIINLQEIRSNLDDDSRKNKDVILMIDELIYKIEE